MRTISTIKNLTSGEKLIFLLSKLILRFTCDRDKISYLSSRAIKKKQIKLNK